MAYSKAVFATLLPNVGGWVGGLVTRSRMYPKDGSTPWHETLKKPSYSPPGWVFGPVWTTLYSSMGYASYLVYRDGGGFQGAAKLPLMAFGVQLALNWAWPYIYFYNRSIKWGLVDILALDVVAITTGHLFHDINPVAGYLFIPYLAWLTLASWLSYKSWEMNCKDSPKIKELQD